MDFTRRPFLQFLKFLLQINEPLGLGVQKFGAELIVKMYVQSTITNTATL
jgi:hypothetical protein